MVYLMQMFLPVVARRSLTAADLMARDLLNQAHQVLLLEVGNRMSLMEGIPDLLPREAVPHPEFSEESAYYSRILHQLAVDAPFISALRRSIEATFGGWASVQSMRRYVANLASTGALKDSTGKNYHAGCCLFRPGQVSLLACVPEVKFKTDALLQWYRGHYRPKVEGIVTELLRVMELGAPLSSESNSSWRRRVIQLGVSVFKDRVTRKTYYFINWAQWFRYRVLTTGTFFRKALVSGLVENPDEGKMKEAATQVEFCRQIAREFPDGKGTMFEASDMVDVPAKLMSAWRLTDDSPVGIVLPEVVLDRSYGLLARERNWKGHLAKSGEIIKVPTTRKFEDLVFTVDLIVSGPNPVERICGVHSGRTIYFQIPGTYPDPLVRTGRDAVGLRFMRLKRGVLKKRNGYYFTATFISENKVMFPRMTEMHVEQLNTFGAYSRAELRKYIKSKMPPGKPGPKTGYSLLEDEVIIELYRPQMTPRQSSRLWEVCANRTPHNIQCRARALRQKLILEGVWDRDKLPHRRYNANMGKEIEAAKRLFKKK